VLVLHGIEERDDGRSPPQRLHLTVRALDARSADLEHDIALGPESASVDERRARLGVGLVRELRGISGSALDQHAREALLEQEGHVLGRDGDATLVGVDLAGNSNRQG